MAGIKVVYVRWMDAWTEQADEAHHEGRAVVPGLCELQEVGFWVGENDDVLTIGMEFAGDDTHPGRARMHIPKATIKELKIVSLETAFKLKKKK